MLLADVQDLRIIFYITINIRITYIYNNIVMLSHYHYHFINIISYHILSCHIISYDVISYHVMSYHIMIDYICTVDIYLFIYTHTHAGTTRGSGTRAASAAFKHFLTSGCSRGPHMYII